MSDIMVQVRQSRTYEEGDPLFAASRRRITCVHLEHICHPKKVTRRSDGLLPVNSAAHAWYEATHQYRIERVSKTEVLRTDLWTGDQQQLGQKHGWHVAADVAARRRGACLLFGQQGSEVWYTGQIDVSTGKLSAVWDVLENRTALRRTASEYQLWPFGQDEKRLFHLIRTDDFDDAVAEQIVAPETTVDRDGNTVVVKARKHSIDWRTGLSEQAVADVLDTSKETDGRNVEQSRTGILRTKTVERVR